MAVIDRMARIYETKLWYPIVLTVYGGLHSPSLAELVRKVSKHGLHVFGLSEMEQYLTASGFRDFQPEVSGSILTFSARRQAA